MFKLGSAAVLAASIFSSAAIAEEIKAGLDPYDPELTLEEPVCIRGRLNLQAQIGDQASGEEPLTRRDVEEKKRAGRILVNMYCPE